MQKQNTRWKENFSCFQTEKNSPLSWYDISCEKELTNRCDNVVVLQEYENGWITYYISLKNACQR